jgi:ABC-type phosphate transport system substrate-binding protein
MKRNLILGAAITATLLAGNAQALTVSDIDGDKFPIYDSTNTRFVYLSGASAAADFLEKVFKGAGIPVEDQICDINLPIWKFSDPLKIQKAYLCTQSKIATNLSLPNDKPNLLIYKRDEGGSGYGVAPMVAEANGDTAGAAIEFLQVESGNCGVKGALTANPTPRAGSVGVTDIKCTYSNAKNNKVIPDFGISDVDPGAFTKQNAPFKTDGTVFSNVTEADLPKLTIVPGAAVVFGTPVTLKLYKALQAAQIAMGTIPATDPVSLVPCAIGDVTNAACMPSLTKQQIATLITGDWGNWDKLKVVTGTTSKTSKGLYTWVKENTNPAISGLVPLANNVHICRRENGSGTQAQLNNFALGYPCFKDAVRPASGNDGLNGNTGATTESTGPALIHENSTSGSMTACLSNLDLGIDTPADGFEYTTASVPKYAGSRWAIGIQSLEKANANFEFVKINGVAPTVENVANGSYQDWFESTFQYNTNHAKFTTDTNLKATIESIIKAATAPAVMGAMNPTFAHLFGNGAYLANPRGKLLLTDGIFNKVLPINPYSHTPTSGVTLDNCRAPVAYQKADSSL